MWRCRVGTDEVLPGRAPTIRDELVHESERSRVTRLFFAGRTAIRKQPLGQDAERALRREVAVLERLRGAVGVAQLEDAQLYPGSFVMADAGDTSLAQMSTPLAIDELIELAVRLARAVTEMHRRGVLHQDITPANVVISGDGAPCLIGFGSATSSAEGRPQLTQHAEIVGTLAYVAPEQIRRTGRSVDQRADLYALGATLYDLATGGPPFGSGDPLRLTHDHLARVPTPPAEVNPAVPAALSQIVMHLLEKDPDQRYQSAEGALYDLGQLRAGAALRVGEHDVPQRLMAPSRLVERKAEVTALEAAFEGAVSGACRGVLVGGAPGVGKTALVAELRPVVTSAAGWFVAGKFDPYRRDLEFDAVNQALRTLGRMLLAEAESELAEVRERILAAVGANAALLTAIVPEFATLLGVPPDAGDPLTAQARAQRTAAHALRAVASRRRPLVVFVDDLQWAGRSPLGVVDLMLSEEPAEGLLLVGAYRDDDVDAAHPLAAPLSRWRAQAGVWHLQMANLPTHGLATLLADMLHAAPATVAGLADAIAPHTRGNPYETVELLEALRRDGALTATVRGWRWDEAAVRARLGHSNVAESAAGRLESIPAAARELIETMALLGGRAELSLLQVVSGQPASVVESQLAPVLDEGLLVAEPDAHPAVRFRHDRIREAILDGLDPPQRRMRQLALARRLARGPELFAVAAAQYLPVTDAVGDPQERGMVVGILQRAAGQAALIGDSVVVDALLAAALLLADLADTATVVELRTGRHAALFSLGRLEEADEEYRRIEALCPSALERADATAVQVRSLSHRTRFAEALALGLESLREFGIAVPAADGFAAELDRGFARLHRWLDDTDAADDLARPEIAGPTLLATTRVIDAVLPVTYFLADPALIAWLALEALRIWIEHGPGPTLVGPAGHAAYHAGPQRGDDDAAYRGLQRIVALGEARGYEPGTSQARHMYAAVSGWFEPIENGVRAAQRAREGLIAGADVAYAGYTYQLAVPYLVDCAPSLASFAAEIHEGLEFLRRTGDEHTSLWIDSYEWLVRVLRREGSAAVSEAIPLDRYAENPLALLYAHLCHGVAAAVFSDSLGLARHSAAAMELLPAAAGFYSIAQVRVLRGLVLAEHARASGGDERAGLLSELDEVTRWLAPRAANAPDNFLHLLRLVEAERAWAVGDFRAAVLAFDAARREVGRRQRPWHRALISERAAQFHLAHGVEQAGYDLLAHARHEYLAWGATAKVDRLDWAYPTLHAPAAADGDSGDLVRRHGAISTGTIDLLGILSASQALSSETSVEQLHSRVVDVLGAMTGATGVNLLLWSDERQDWLRVGSDSRGSIAVSEPGHEDAVPMSVLRYTQRIGEPLIVADATGDDRFARDPYFTGVRACSLLAVPVFSRGALRAALVLENRLIRGAFSAERLEAVKLIAGQLAVSLDNAQLYAELATSRTRIIAAADEARRRLERDLHDGAQQRLVQTILTLQVARSALSGAEGEGPKLVEQAIEIAERSQSELRELARGIHPSILTTGGLRPALRALARRSAVPVAVDVNAEGRLPEHAEVTAYFFVSEALTNVAKHARASRVQVMVDSASDNIRIAVSDDGIGGAAPTRGSGMVGLKDRVEALGGTFTLDSPAGQGTRLYAEVPLIVAGPTNPS
jgi:signal transduction histidine kinase